MKLLDKILEYLGIKDKYVKLVEPENVYDLDGIIIETSDTKDIVSDTYEGQSLSGMQVLGYENTRSNKNSEAQAFEEMLRKGLDLGDIHRKQSETGRKYTIINDEHYSNRQENAKINISNSRILSGSINLDKINIYDSELRNVIAYRSSEQDQSMDL